jgi:hypothetical protein
MSDFEIIEEILIEASAYSLRLEVIETATKLMDADSELSSLQAYELAFQDWIK